MIIFFDKDNPVFGFSELGEIKNSPEVGLLFINFKNLLF
jgi:hypothetical protein